MSTLDNDSEQEHEELQTVEKTRRAPISPAAQLQQRLGNAGLLQLRAQRSAASASPVQASGMSVADATDSLNQHARQHQGEGEIEAITAASEAISIPSGGEKLPTQMQQHAKEHLGVGVEDVEVVRNADSATAPVQARAFATHDNGTPKVVLSSDVDLATPDGQFTLMHEVSHIAQQKQGKAEGLDGLRGDPGHRDALERDADDQAKKMLNH